MTKIISIVSVSHGTMRPSDLIPCFLSILGTLDKEAQAGIEKEYADILDCDELDEDLADVQDAQDKLVNNLFDLLSEYAPAYCYFGAHEGDGSDYGFWPSFSAIEDNRQGNPPTLPSGDETPSDNNGRDVNPDHDDHFLVVSDHGNMTMYEWIPSGIAPRSSGLWRETWSCV